MRTAFVHLLCFLWEGIKFAVLGLVCLAIYYGLLIGLTEAGVWYMLSAVIAYVPAHIANFLLQKHGTFRNTDTLNVWRQAREYALLMVFLLPMNNGILFALVEYGSIWYVWSQFVATIVVSAVSFVLQRHFVFRH